MAETNKYSSIKIIAGSVLILIGLIFGANLLNYLPGSLSSKFLSKELLLIVLGLGFLAIRIYHIAGWVMIIIGVLFTMDNYGMIPDVLQELMWCAIMILAGIGLLYKARLQRNRSNKAKKQSINRE